MPACLHIDITDACGSHRSFEAQHARLDCGAGALEFQAGHPTYCRKFGDALLHVSEALGDTLVMVTKGTAAFEPGTLNILCESFREAAGGIRART